MQKTPLRAEAGSVAQGNVNALSVGFTDSFPRGRAKGMGYASRMKGASGRPFSPNRQTLPQLT